jgi:hypothetical protein
MEESFNERLDKFKLQMQLEAPVFEKRMYEEREKCPPVWFRYWDKETKQIIKPKD